MALTFFQKLRVMFRGWSRRREEAQEQFLRQNTGWGPQQKAAAPAAVAKPAAPSIAIDMDGLQVAYLDDSRQIDYFLDTLTGEVIEVRNKPAPPGDRFQRVPSRSDDSDADERRAFVESLERSPVKDALSVHQFSAEFRRILATDRTTERAWYNFRNARATRAIESWLRSLGLQAPGRG